MKRVLVLGKKESDWLQILRQSRDIELRVIDPEVRDAGELAGYDAILITGGTEDEPLLLNAEAQFGIEAHLGNGKRVLAEYTAGAAGIYFQLEKTYATRFRRMVHLGERVAGLEPGDLLDDQSNQLTPPFQRRLLHSPLLVSKKGIVAHSRVDSLDGMDSEVEEWAACMHGRNLMLCCFRACNFVRARFAPSKKWAALFSYMLSWLCGADIDAASLPPAYSLGIASPLDRCIDDAMGWFARASMLKDGGARGVYEGLASDIKPDGTQAFMPMIRADCTGETMLAHHLYGMLRGDGEATRRARLMGDFCFGRMQVKEGFLKGMVRWSELAWGTCYQDDVARVLIPQLLICIYGNADRHLDDVVAALEFLMATTGTDGTRIPRTDNLSMDAAAIKALAMEPGECPSAHYNAFYVGALLLCSMLTGRADMREMGARCLTAIMNVYPDTERQVSETEEKARLVMPLAFLYKATGEELHLRWLNRVCADLDQLGLAVGALAIFVVILLRDGEDGAPGLRVVVDAPAHIGNRDIEDLRVGQAALVLGPLILIDPPGEQLRLCGV